VQNRVFAAARAHFIRFSRKPFCTGREVLATLSQTTGFLRASAIGVKDRSGARRSCGNSFVRWRRESELRSTSDGTFRHPYSTLLRSVGTEFKVMQELLRHSTLRSTLDVYTQAVTPAKHAAQAAVVSLVFFEGAGGGSVIAEGATASLPRQE
jgi:integrase